MQSPFAVSSMRPLDLSASASTELESVDKWVNIPGIPSVLETVEILLLV